MEKFGIPVKPHIVVDEIPGVAERIRNAGLAYPLVIKAQVQTGGRGKAGGVQFAEDEDGAVKLCEKMLHMDIRGFRADELMISEKAEISREWYLSILLDRLTKSPLLIFSPAGGVDIEETAGTNPGMIAKVPLDPLRGVADYSISYIMDKTGADPRYRDALRDTVQKLFRMFFDYHAMLVEINPLGLDESGRLIALDGKVEIDDNALSVLPDIVAFREKLQEDPQVIEARKVNFHFIPMEDSGTVGVMSNGSGMLMSCIDLISKKGMKVHAALDLGGGATADRIAEAIRIMFKRPRIDTVFICIFGGITRCDEAARGACTAMAGTAGKRLILRMEGTNKEEAVRIIAGSGLPIVSAGDIPEAVEAICRGGREE
jgi:succinyl-CoA synthetase beta subunit